MGRIACSLICGMLLSADAALGQDSTMAEPNHVRIRLSGEYSVLDSSTPLGIGRRHVEKLTDGWFLVMASPGEIVAWLAAGLITDAGEVSADDKISHGLRQALARASPNDSFRILLVCHPDVAESDAVSRVDEALGAAWPSERDSAGEADPPSSRVEYVERRMSNLVLGVELLPHEVVDVAPLDFVSQLWLPETSIGGDLLISQDTINVDALKGSGTPVLGYRPNGSGLAIGQWDVGSPRVTHGMLSPRVTYVDADCKASPAPPETHSTEVAGVLVGAPIAGITAMEGMAHQASIRAHSYDNDFVEMSADAEKLIRISNHSYSPRRGWYQNLSGTWIWFGAAGDTEDYLLGKYDTQPRELDAVARTDDLLIVRSAGNLNTNTSGTPHSHVNTPAYRPSECTTPYTLGGAESDTHQANNANQALDVLPQVAVAKNALVVGNALDITNDPVTSADIVAALVSATSFGPSDDMRVKPDIYANGRTVTTASAASDTATVEVSGTSESAPAVAGTSALLFETYKSLNDGREPIAAELRAVILQTAIDKNPVVTGNPSPGPDCRYGWGLVDALAAGTLVERDALAGLDAKYIVRGTYRGTALLYDVVGGTGGPMEMATMVWTDPPGVASTAGIDTSTPTLVNDLDLTALSTGGTQYAWRLNHCSSGMPNQALNDALNHADNVEKVERTSSTSTFAWSQLRIAHTGTLVGSQSYVIVSNAPLRLTSSQAPRFADVAPRYHTDLRTNVVDVVQALRFSVDTDTPRHHELFLADVAPHVSLGGAPELVRPTGNNAVNVADVVLMLRASVGLIQFSPSGSLHYRVRLPGGATYSSVQVTLQHLGVVSPSAPAVSPVAVGWTCGTPTTGSGSVTVTCSTTGSTAGPLDLMDFNMDFSTAVPAQDDVQLSTCISSGTPLNTCSVRSVR